MQKIYGAGVGVVKSDKLRTITKTENFRCSRQVIRVLNKMRPKLQQVPAGDNVEGDVHFFSGTHEADHEAKLKAARSLLARKGWRDEETKILMLTHKKIAGALKYGGLLSAYSTRNRFGCDELLDGSDPFVQVFDKIERLSRAYQQKDFASVFQLLERGDMRLRHHSDKARISGSLEKLASSRASWSVGAVLDFVFGEQLLVKTKAIRALEERLRLKSRMSTRREIELFWTLSAPSLIVK